MASINKVLLIGHLGQDPELRGDGDICNFRIATSESWKDKSTGEKKEKTEWHRICVFGKSAEHCAQYLKKGRQVHVEGKIQTREWEDKEGNKRYTTEIVVSQFNGRVTFLGKLEDYMSDGEQEGQRSMAFKKPVEVAPLNDDDIPF